MGTTEKEIQDQLKRFGALNEKLKYQVEIHGIDKSVFPIIEQMVKLQDARADFIASEYKDLMKINPDFAKKLVEQEKELISAQAKHIDYLGHTGTEAIRNMANKNMVELENIRSDFISAITDSSQEAGHTTAAKGKPKGRH
ncbi:hypothetical protein [Runella sp. SP2]|uniref:hypothetical protein n=1 Tax=Runella sp. SP2 TaxID=2268026 RepID=UPI000F07A215|nr:hypothetical protein [Runella sp. SP2]AYQ36657.1 hypothetical protein DTQ70_30500 [Runella sp. SP2]